MAHVIAFGKTSCKNSRSANHCNMQAIRGTVTSLPVVSTLTFWSVFIIITLEKEPGDLSRSTKIRLITTSHPTENQLDL